MRILIASTGTIPGYSGGWTTTLDLLGDEHQAMYVITGAKPGLRTMEGVRYLGLGLGRADGGMSILPGRLSGLAARVISPAVLKRSFRKFNADFIMCLDESMGFAARRTGLPYGMRFHRKVDRSVLGGPLEALLDGALFATASPGADVPGVEVIPHNQDLSRFDFQREAEPRRALLLTAVNDVHEPELFIEGVCLSRHVSGDIIGTGPSLKRIRRACLATGGRVRLLDPLPRLETGRLSGRYQIGVATIIRRDRVVYQMKINMYLACGMHTLVKPYTHIVKEAPELVDVFSSPAELAERMDYIAENWRDLEARRVRARNWIVEHYSVEIPRRRFREILENAFHRPVAGTGE